MKRKKHWKQGCSVQHERTLDNLIERLKGNGEHFIRDFDYYDSNGNIAGQVDLLSYDMKKGVYKFYEVKSVHKTQRYQKAREQYSRFLEYHKSFNVVGGVYVTPTKVKRIRLNTS